MKGVIIAAGYGTRFLPVTKTIPKEMLPVIDRPAVDYVIDEFYEAGIRDVIVVTSRRKKSLEDYLDREVELENLFTSEGSGAKLDKIKCRDDLNFVFIRQKEMLGTGHAMLLLKEYLKNDVFAVAYPDDLFTGENVTKRLIDEYYKTGLSSIALQHIEGDVSKYGVVDYFSKNGEIYINKIVEKPRKGEEPSNLVSVGRYLFKSDDFFVPLEEGYKAHKSGEYYHIHALNVLAGTSKLSGVLLNARRYDTGNPLGFLEAVVDFALSRDDIKDDFVKILKARL
jgi:UTP--glucose-1-phosphate uridylyltransferase